MFQAIFSEIPSNYCPLPPPPPPPSPSPPSLYLHPLPNDNGSFKAVTRAASASGGATDTCSTNILAATPVINEMGKTYIR